MSAQIEKWVLELCGEVVQVTGFGFFQVRSKEESKSPSIHPFTSYPVQGSGSLSHVVGRETG